MKKLGIVEGFYGGSLNFHDRNSIVELLSKIGSIQVVSGDDQIYKIIVDDLGSRGTTRATYQKIKSLLWPLFTKLPDKN